MINKWASKIEGTGGFPPEKSEAGVILNNTIKYKSSSLICSKTMKIINNLVNIKIVKAQRTA